MKRIEVAINDEQLAALEEIAMENGCTVADILGAFAADLSRVDSNGSDERQLARDYFIRTHLYVGWL